MQTTRIALATMADSRADYLAVRRPLLEEEKARAAWLESEFCVFSGGSQPGQWAEINSHAAVNQFAAGARAFDAQALVIFIPIWADPIFAVRLGRLLELPTLLLGNDRPDTSSFVGMLGAGGALDQIGLPHQRSFDYTSPDGQRQVRAFLGAAGAVARLRGQRLGLFGGWSLGIFSAAADPVQSQQLFGVDVQYIDQLYIRQAAEALPVETVEQHQQWLSQRLAGVRYGGKFTPQAFERQLRSYLATSALAQEYALDFVGVKCQPEMSDGYATQCVAHLLMNGLEDADGAKPAMVHACESDADGALTMQILHQLNGGLPTALLDVRWYDPQREAWVLANCGAVPAAFFATAADPGGLSGLTAQPHVFGEGGGGSLSGNASPGTVTLARLSRRNNEYWMAILPGQVETGRPEVLQQVTPVFPKAVVRCPAGQEILAELGSNHLHMSAGDLTEELLAFCRLIGIPARVWN